MEADAEATVMVMASFAPGAGVLVAAESVVFEAAGCGTVTVTVRFPLEEAYVESPG